jgi:RHS repeat-associated protein
MTLSTVCADPQVLHHRYHITGKERDAESGNDYFEARYYASSMGRFMSPDWAAQEEPVPYAKLDDPQTLNLYSYVRNNPLSQVDPDGHDPDADPDPQAQAAAIPIVVGIGTTTGEGAAEGSAAGPLGTAVGAGLGFLVGAGAAALEYSPKLGPVPTSVVGTVQLKAPAAPATPDKTGGGKNDQKTNPDRAQSARDKAEGAKSDLAAAKKLPPSQQRSEKIKQAEKQVKHWTGKAAEKSENHSQKPKGQQ